MRNHKLVLDGKHSIHGNVAELLFKRCYGLSICSTFDTRLHVPVLWQVRLIPPCLLSKYSCVIFSSQISEKVSRHVFTASPIPIYQGRLKSPLRLVVELDAGTVTEPLLDERVV